MSWEPKPIIALDFDDMEDKYDRNGLNFLLYWKAKVPNLKVTMFAIPGRCTSQFLEMLKPYQEWMQLGVHGWHHNDNFECQKWDKYTAEALLERVDKLGSFVKVFRAPGWQITYPQPYNEAPDPSKPVNSDPHLVYDALTARNYIIADQHYNKERRPDGLKVYCSCNPYFMHGHVEDINTSDPAGRNGMRQIEEEHGVPWNEDTVFKFISELTTEELKCQ